MARIIYPEDFSSQKTLLENIKAKDTADGANSLLKPYLTSKGIVLATLATTANSAKTFDDSRLVLFKQSTNYTQLRDLTFDPVVERLKAEVQFLKGFYKPNVNALGDWGITVINNAKIQYPSNFDELSALATNFFNKHLGYAAGTSPLQPYITKNAINVTNDKASVGTAQGYAVSATTSSKNSENATQQRDILWQPVVAILHGIGDYLINLYGSNSKGLGDWGFVVDNSVAKPKTQSTKLKLGEQITIRAVLIGSTLENTGTIDIHVYKGSNTSGNPIIVHAGEKLGIQKGYSVITVSNPSELQSAAFTTVRSA